MDPPRNTDAVLNQSTRARLFELLKQSGQPVATTELAGMLELHPNGVRTHLERMREAGLLERRRSSGGRGRPRDEWELAATADPGGAHPTAYADLVRWLARAYPSDREALLQVESVGRQVGLEAGRRIGRDRVPEPPEPHAALVSTLGALGFQPELTAADAGSFTCRLGNCPYREAVRENQPVVCGLHRGMTVGLLESIDSRLRLDEFTPREPDQAGCLVVVAPTAPAGD